MLSENKEEAVIIKLVYTVSSIISFIYGFTILLILDMVNHKVNLTPVFRRPSVKGLIAGVLSIILYLLLIIGLGFIAKLKSNEETKRYIINNIIIFILGLILFWGVGAAFFIETPNYA